MDEQTETKRVAFKVQPVSPKTPAEWAEWMVQMSAEQMGEWRTQVLTALDKLVGLGLLDTDSLGLRTEQMLYAVGYFNQRVQEAGAKMVEELTAAPDAWALMTTVAWQRSDRIDAEKAMDWPALGHGMTYAEFQEVLRRSGINDISDPTAL